MAGLTGADAEALEQLGQHMQAAADRLESVRGEIGVAFGRAQWEGEDAHHFHDLWQHRLSGQLLSASQATRGAAAVAVRNAQQQRDTSATDGGGGTSGLYPFGPGLGDPGAVEPWNPLSLDTFTTLATVAGGVGTVLDVAKKLPRLARGLGHVGEVGDVAGSVSDGWRLGSAIASGDTREIKISAVDATADVAFAVAGAAAVGFPPAEIAVVGASIAWDFVPDDAKVAAAERVIDAANEVGQAAVHIGNAAADVGNAVGGLAAGGFNNAKKLLGW